MKLRANEAGAYAGVMPAIKEAVRMVPFGIIEPAAHLAVLATCHELASKQAGRPSAVMGLQ